MPEKTGTPEGYSGLTSVERSLPTSWYRDPDHFQRELRDIWYRQWLYVDRADTIPSPRDYRLVTIGDQSIILLRRENGTFQAFHNTCRHRGTRLVEDRGSCRDGIVCPFHGWSYRLDGSLRGRRDGDCFDEAVSSVGLSPLPVIESAGLIWLSLDPDHDFAGALPMPDEFITSLADLSIDNYQLLQRRPLAADANWKLVTELSLESYHFSTLHRDSVATFLRGNAVVDTFANGSRWAFPFADITRLADLDESAWPDELQGSCTFTVAPGVMLIVNASGVQMIRAEPGRDPGQCTVNYVGVAPADTDLEEARAAFDFGGEVFCNEDLPAAESIQRNLHAGGAPLTFGRNEPLLQFWHRLWDEMLEGAGPAQ